MTKLYAMNLTPYMDGRWRSLLPRLPQARQERALACRFDADRARVAGAGMLLQTALERAGIPAERQRFAENPFGKPYLTEFPDLHVSLSHGGPWAVCAVSDRPVGVDVELPRCSYAVAKRYFHPEELPQATDADRLCRLWTAKEAFVKALGTGLTTPLNSFRVELEPLRLHQTHSPLPYVLHEYRLSPCRLCLCAADSRPPLELVE